MTTKYIICAIINIKKDNVFCSFSLELLIRREAIKTKAPPRLPIPKAATVDRIKDVNKSILSFSGFTPIRKNPINNEHNESAVLITLTDNNFTNSDLTQLCQRSFS